MRMVPTAFPTKAGIFALLLPLAGCSIDVREGRSGRHSDVDIRTPAGELSVRTDVDARDTGLAVYPGAWATYDDDDPESANVNIGTPWFGLEVVAAKFESDDAPERILDFYRDQLSAYGSVTSCRGDVNFKGRKGDKRPVCHEKPHRSGMKLVTGTKERQRIVAVKPRGSGSEFSLVYVRTRGDN